MTVEDELPEVPEGSLILQVEPVDPLPADCSYDTLLRVVQCDLGDIPDSPTWLKVQT